MSTQKLKVSRLYSDLDLDLSTPHPVTGDLPKKTDVNAVKQAIQILMMTNFYERRFSPRKGGNVVGLLFEPMSNLAASTIATQIELMLKNYEPRAKVQSVEVIPDFLRNSYTVTLRFFVVGINKPQILSANLERLR